MIVISSTGGSGSSFVADQFSMNHWKVCLRPDGGQQKATHSEKQIYDERTIPHFESLLGKKPNQEQMFEEAYVKLRKAKNDNLMLLCMTWGGLGYLNNIEEKTIFLVRDPVFAFNSYSGGGWRKEGGQRRIKYVGASGANDKKWIDLWLGKFAHWKQGALHAINSAKEGNGHLVRYHSFAKDWEKIEGVPPIHKNFKSKDEILKLQGFLSAETIKYIREETNDVWKEIKSFSHE